MPLLNNFLYFVHTLIVVGSRSEFDIIYFIVTEETDVTAPSKLGNKK